MPAPSYADYLQFVLEMLRDQAQGRDAGRVIVRGPDPYNDGRRAACVELLQVMTGQAEAFGIPRDVCAERATRGPAARHEEGVPEDLRAFVESEPWHAWLISYVIAMGRVTTVTLHRGAYREGRHLRLVDTEHIHAPVWGGPYRLAIVAEGDRYALRSEDGGFVVIFGSATWGLA